MQSLKSVSYLLYKRIIKNVNQTLTYKFILYLTKHFLVCKIAHLWQLEKFLRMLTPKYFNKNAVITLNIIYIPDI